MGGLCHESTARAVGPCRSDGIGYESDAFACRLGDPSYVAVVAAANGVGGSLWCCGHNNLWIAWCRRRHAAWIAATGVGSIGADRSGVTDR